MRLVLVQVDYLCGKPIGKTSNTVTVTLPVLTGRQQLRLDRLYMLASGCLGSDGTKLVAK